MKPLCFPLLAFFFVPTLHADEPFSLRDGDRVVLVGSTLIEREQRYGYWETALTRRYPDKSIIFRNLGWSGDTVFGDARAGFGTQADGFRHLKEHVLALKPTVIIIGYGTNESFDGPKGLPHFVKGLEMLLDAFAPTKARIVLLSPLKQDKLGPPLPDPTENNKNLRLYADAARDLAKRRGHLFVDLYSLLSEERFLTEEGIHLTPYGYWRSADVLTRALGLPDTDHSLAINADGKVQNAQGIRVVKVSTSPLRVKYAALMLPAPSAPEERERRPVWEGPPVVKLNGGPGGFRLVFETAQADKLRQAIVAKNRLYFYRWRPENETYLFGFRKHEQGQNAREIPQFDPLIAEKEKEIAKLRVPASQTIELQAAEKK